MEIIKKSPKKTIAILAFSVIVTALVGYGMFVYLTNKPSFTEHESQSQEDGLRENDVSTDPATDDEKAAGLKAKEDFIERNDSTDKGSGTGGSEQKTNLSISSVSQNGSLLIIRTIIDGIDDKGTCGVTLSRGGDHVVRDTVGTQAMHGYSVCAGFDIDTAELVKGNWNLTVEYTGSLGRGSVSQDVDID